MNLLSKVLIAPKVISQEGIDALVHHMKTSKTEDLSVFDPDKSNQTRGTGWITDKRTRDTQIAPIEPVFPQVNELMHNIVKQVINPFYQFEVDSSEVPQLLCYDVGGHYQPHIDGEGVWTAPDQTQLWRKTVDRDLSMVLYLNDGFEGGDFVFPDLHIRVRPEPGLLVCFPSNRYYRHGVEPVTKGNRYSMVTWMTVKGFESMETQSNNLKAKYGVC
jgi:predicted 2-oxoglutarate/Fe(II)-dependent dioxygenase YbiX